VRDASDHGNWLGRRQVEIRAILAGAAALWFAGHATQRLLAALDTTGPLALGLAYFFATAALVACPEAALMRALCAEDPRPSTLVHARCGWRGGRLATSSDTRPEADGVSTSAIHNVVDDHHHHRP
jgi:hypothetical protein